MNGKYYGVYDLKRDEACVGIFESTAEVCKFFGGITESRVWCGKLRNNNSALAFKSDRYEVVAFEEPTKLTLQKILRKRFGAKMYKICKEGIFYRQDDVLDWKLFAANCEEAMELCS